MIIVTSFPNKNRPPPYMAVFSVGGGKDRYRSIDPRATADPNQGPPASWDPNPWGRKNLQIQKPSRGVI